MGTDFIYKECVYAHKRMCARVICSTWCICTAIGVQILAYLSIQQ